MRIKKSPEKKQGYSLITTMFLMAAISTMMAMLVQSGTQQAFTARRMTNRIKATAYAEAGFEYALAQLKTNWDNRTDASACVPSTP
jgi:type II secretory pathway component PulK